MKVDLKLQFFSKFMNSLYMQVLSVFKEGKRRRVSGKSDEQSTLFRYSGMRAGE
jgi:hypothetical protein